MNKNFTQNNKQKPDNQIIISGWHSVLSALNNPRRTITKIFANKLSYNDVVIKIKGTHHYNSVKDNISIVDDNKFLSMFKEQSVHQGIAALVMPLKSESIEFITQSSEEVITVVVLDQVHDPRNIGAIIRSCAAFGVKAIIMQEKNSPKESEVLVRASVGAIEVVPIITVVNISRAIELLKDVGFWSIALHGDSNQTINEIESVNKTLLILGNEGEGIRDLVLKSADYKARIPINSTVESLNVSNATAIALYDRYIKKNIIPVAK